MVITRGEERAHFVEEKKHKGVASRLKEVLNKQNDPLVMSSLKERQTQRQAQAVSNPSENSDEIELE